MFSIEYDAVLATGRPTGPKVHREVHDRRICLWDFPMEVFFIFWKLQNVEICPLENPLEKSGDHAPPATPVF